MDSFNPGRKSMYAAEATKARNTKPIKMAAFEGLAAFTGTVAGCTTANTGVVSCTLASAICTRWAVELYRLNAREASFCIRSIAMAAALELSDWLRSLAVA